MTTYTQTDRIDFILLSNYLVISFRFKFKRLRLILVQILIGRKQSRKTLANKHYIRTLNQSEKFQA
jgi:hypothetical protein